MIGLISDAHGNGSAFDSAVSLLKKHGAQKLYFLGDAVGYIPSDSVLASISKLGAQIKCIRGNHEQMLLTGNILPNRDEVYQLGRFRDTLNDVYLNMISEWPSILEETVDGEHILFVHGSPYDPVSGYVYPDSDLSVFDVSYDWIFMAHTHRPFVREFEGRNFVNIGSCGMPRDDGRFGSVALFDPKKKIVRILRFNITLHTESIRKYYQIIHPSVRELFLRNAAEIIGEKC
jgi:putative phosphoesterase